MAAAINPNIEEASYVRAEYYYERSAGRLTRYLFRRPENKLSPSSGGWYSIPLDHRLGNSETFIRAAESRAKKTLDHHRKKGTDISQNHAYSATSYVHVVISVSNRDELTATQIAALSEPWITDQDGEIMPHVGAVHYDGDNGPHLHIAVARGHFETEELQQLKDATDGLALEMENEREMAAEMKAEMSMEMEI